MLRVYADFNSRTSDGACFILLYNGRDLEAQVATLNFSRGDKVILYQDDADFEIEAILDVRHVDALNRDCWVAIPDYSTLVRC